MTNPVKDRSGVGLPPKSERRAAGKLARERRRRAERRMKILKVAATVVGVIAVVGGVSVACGAFDPDTANPSASASPGAVVLDPKLQTKPDVSAGSGDLQELKVEKLITGTGPETKSGQTLSVNYTGVSFTTGEKFDSSWDSGEPYTLKLGAGEVIPGWDQGLVGLPVGSRVQLDIPTALAYNGAPDKPAGPLRFVVDILSAT